VGLAALVGTGVVGSAAFLVGKLGVGLIMPPMALVVLAADLVVSSLNLAVARAGVPAANIAAKAITPIRFMERSIVLVSELERAGVEPDRIGYYHFCQVCQACSDGTRDVKRTRHTLCLVSPRRSSSTGWHPSALSTSSANHTCCRRRACVLCQLQADSE
jgi:hypothetical protein